MHDCVDSGGSAHGGQVVLALLKVYFRDVDSPDFAGYMRVTYQPQEPFFFTAPTTSIPKCDDHGS